MGLQLLSSIQGKLLEKNVYNRLLTHLELHHLLDPKHGGFRPNHSTIETIVKCSENICQDTNKGEITLGIYIDLNKAFDTVNHDILIQKLGRLGLNLTNINWISNYTMCINYL